MDIKNHPCFGKGFNRFCGIALGLAGAVGAIYAYVLIARVSHYQTVALTVFFVAIVCVIAACGIRFFRVPCPDCGGRTKVSQWLVPGEWTAACSRCRVIWMLSVSRDT